MPGFPGRVDPNPSSTDLWYVALAIALPPPHSARFFSLQNPMLVQVAPYIRNSVQLVSSRCLVVRQSFDVSGGRAVYC